MEIINTPNAPEAIGPYVQAVKANGFIFTSGQIPIDPATNTIVDGDTTTQAKVVLSNLDAVLRAAGTRLSNTVKTTIYLADMNDFAAVNDVYASCFPDHKPARSTVEVSRLPKDVKVEMDMMASASS